MTTEPNTPSRVGELGAPLEGLVVADFSRVLAGPLATMTLADLGARVIKIERPGLGDDTRAWGPPYSDHGATYFESVNRGKQSIALDLTDPQDRQTAFDLAAHADVVIENFAAGTMDRLGLGYDAISAVNPGSIFCSINGFGSAGGKDLLGYDFIVQAVGGLMSITGDAEGEPTKVGVALVDVLTGKDAVTGILAALIARGRTGRGDRLELTLLTSLLGSLVNQGQAGLETGRPGRAMGNQHPSIAPYETLHCRDGLIAVACGNDVQFGRLAGALGGSGLAERSEYATNPERVAHREALIQDLEALLGAREVEHWVQVLHAARVPAGKVNTIPEALQLAESLGLEPTVEVGAGWTREVRHPIRWTAYRTTDPTPPPSNDADADQVRAWLAAQASPPGVG
ncbi:CaiB/BaiF CoA transferase family protein [Leekyejoonella antrihumi]|uniref:CaiB/BaiF CoA transferase family protein n=1 Tax=Leekyejoonella antrihumi TaxID=1660198 RepID=UPI001FE84AA2|nr:CoA transferase [Leekyejoonella antrihumi]